PACSIEGDAVRHRERETAASEIEHAHALKACRMTPRGELQPFLLDHIESDESEIAHVLLDEVRDIVVAHEEHIERHVLPEPEELVLAARELESTAGEQIERGVGEPPRLLHGELEAHIAVS